MRRILVINGPNLNLLGTRHPDTYGSTALSELDDACREWGRELGLEIETFQSNHEGELIDRIHSAREEVDALVINPGALTHYSYALHDAIEAVGLPAVEVHISNIEEREAWRRMSVVRSACVYTIYGRGVDGYGWALRHLRYRSQWPFETVAYGDSKDQVFDLRHPSEPPSNPNLAVVLHGGFWMHQWTRDTTDGIAVDLSCRGLVTANLEYRRTGKGGGWPASLDDVVTGVRAALSSAKTDPRALILVGHSAGAQLAIIAAHQLTPPPRLVVSIGGVLDLVTAADQDLADGATLRFLGGARPEEASPVAFGAVPSAVLVAHGAEDRLVPPEHSMRFAAATGVEALTLPGGHFAPLEPTSQAWREIAGRMTGLNP